LSALEVLFNLDGIGEILLVLGKEAEKLRALDFLLGFRDSRR